MYGVSENFFLNFQTLQIKCQENLEQLQMDIGMTIRSNFECTLGTAEGQKIWICTLVFDFPFLFLFYIGKNWGPCNTSAPPLQPALRTC